MTPEPNEHDYQAELKQHEFVKTQGIEAWAESIADMMPHCDPDKRILIKEGMKAVLQGPPRFRIPPIQSLSDKINADFIQPPPHIFEQMMPDGTIICWDWLCLASRGTHSSKHPPIYGPCPGPVRIWKGSELVIELSGEAASKFWEWKTFAIKAALSYPIARAV